MACLGELQGDEEQRHGHHADRSHARHLLLRGLLRDGDPRADDRRHLHVLRLRDRDAAG